MLPVLLVTVDNTVLGFALPKIAEALRPTASQQLWMIDAYSLVLAGLLVSMGSLGDRVGHRKLLLIGSFGFGGLGADRIFRNINAADYRAGLHGDFRCDVDALHAGIDTFGV